MKTIGIIGGMAWPSSSAYYKSINQQISDRLGGFHCAQLILVQTDFDQIFRWEQSGQWEEIAQTLLALQKKLKAAGADFFLVACNTMHKPLSLVKHQLELPFVHIVDATAERITAYKTVGLLGTRATMTEDYFVGGLSERYGKSVLVPPESGQKAIESSLISELAKGIFTENARTKFREIIAELVARGAEAIILGCTEIGMLVKQEDSSVPIVDTLVAHVDAAVELALEEREVDLC